jgi:outer membrane receptor for ferrienterochelin and colicins
VLCIYSSSTSATELKSTDINIIGHVIDKETKEHLSYINILLKGTTIGTATDHSGHYYLKNLPEGTFTIIMQSIGYKSIERTVQLKKGKTIEVNFEAEEDNQMLENVVVTGSRNETIRQLYPGLMNVMDTKLFETTNAVSIGDGLNFQPGVRVETNCQNCGTQQVRINGMEGPYTQLMMDGRPIFSALTGVYGLEQIPANMIERVEVVRGGGSALFGSSAIAGTINIITKEPTRNTAQAGYTLNMIGGSAADHNATFNASLVTDNNKAGIYFFGQARNRSAYDHDGDGYTEISSLQAQTVGFRSFLKTGLNGKFTLEYHNMSEFRRGGNLLELPPHEADIAEQLHHDIHGGGIKYDYFSDDYKHRFNIYTSMQSTLRKSYYGTGKNPNAYGNTTDLTSVSGARYSYAFDNLLFMPATLTIGTEYNFNDLEDTMLGYKRELHQKIHIASLYAQNEWKNDRWGLLLGGRLDNHSMIDNPIFSPRATVRYNPTSDINFRVSYGTGFRAPQAFDEDLHIEAVGGDVSIIQLAENLKAERSQSYSASVDYYKSIGEVQTNFLLEGFYTELKDVFVLEELGENEAGNLLLERRNGKGAKIAGVTAEAKAAYRWLEVQAGATFQRNRYTEAEAWSKDVEAQRKMFKTPDLYGYLTSTFTPIKNFSTSITGTYTGSMLVQHYAGYIAEDRNETTPSFFDLNVNVTYNIPIQKQVNLELKTGVKNIFNSYQSDLDQGPLRDAGYVYGPSLPRGFYVGCKLIY